LHGIGNVEIAAPVLHFVFVVGEVRGSRDSMESSESQTFVYCRNCCQLRRRK
jgi:hypothetical protein